MANVPELEMREMDQNNSVVARDVAGRLHINLQYKHSACCHRLVVVHIHIQRESALSSRPGLHNMRAAWLYSKFILIEAHIFLHKHPVSRTNLKIMF